MEIREVSTGQHRQYVPLKGWDMVEAALTAYNSRQINGSRATEDQLVKDVTQESGQMAGAVLILGSAIMAGDKDAFVTRMIEEAKVAIEASGRWHGSYDYDAMGTAFFKSSVDIIVLDSETELHGVGLRAAYVGAEPEVHMATFFDTERCLKQSYIELEIEPSGKNRFTFDFEMMLRKLDSVLGTQRLKGSAIAKSMLHHDGWGSPAFALAHIDGVTVSIQTHRIGDRVDITDGERTVVWSRDGSCLSGPLQQDYSSRDEDAKCTPTMRIALMKEGTDGYDNRSLIWNRDEQRNMVALTDKIAAALR